MMTEQLITPRVDEREWLRLEEELAYLFAKPLEMSRWQYVDTLPSFTPQPAEYRGRFDNLGLVQPPTSKLPVKTILDILDIAYSREGVLKLMRNWGGDKGGFKTPAIAHAIWLNDGSSYLNIAPSVLRTDLAEDARVGTILDGVFLYVADRGVLRRHFLSLPGSDLFMYLCLGNDGPSLDYGNRNADPRYGSVVAGRKVITRDLVA